MADFYVKNGTGGTDDGSSWANAAESIKLVVDGSGYQALAAGDTIYVDEGHQETYAASTAINFPSTLSNPVKVIVVDTATTDAVSAVTSTVTIITTTSGDNITLDGGVYFWGIRLSPYDELHISAGSFVTFEKSYIKTSSSDARIYAVGDSVTVRLIYTDIEDFTLRIQNGATTEWLSGSWVDGGASAADSLILPVFEGGNFIGRDLNLSAYSGTYMVTAPNSGAQSVTISLTRCKMWTSWSPLDGTIINPSIDHLINLESCHVDDGYHFFYRLYFSGDVREDTGIYRTGGATYDGTNGFTAKIAALVAGPKEFISPIRFKLCQFYADIATEKTLTAHFTYDSATLLYDDDIWLEVDYNDATDEALGVLVDTKAATPTATPGRAPFTDVSGAETWNGTGGFTNPQEETLEKAITGGVGIVTVWACLAKPSITVYVDPDVTVS